MKGVLFLCVANTARSQLAEALARAILPPGIAVWSAGSAPGELHPSTVTVLAEIGIDASGQRAKPISAVPLDQVDTVVTLCDEEICPPLPAGVRHMHLPVPNPARAAAPTDPLAPFRAVRDELRRRLPDLLRT